MNLELSREYTERLQDALKQVQAVRNSVGAVFSKLVDGMRNLPPGQEKERKFLKDVGDCLVEVNKNVDDLEKVGCSINPPWGSVVTGNAGLVGLDLIVDKTTLLSQQNQAYQWSNKVLDQGANHGSLYIHQNGLKRPMSSHNVNAKRIRKNPAMYPLQYVDAIIDQAIRSSTTLSVQKLRPSSNMPVLLVKSKVFRVTILMRGLLVENIIMRSISELGLKENGDLDIWKKSKHLVFQKVTEQCLCAMLHFYFPNAPEHCVKSLLKWLESYNTLFSAKCKKCDMHLQNGMPPTWRDLRTIEPYHHACRF